MVMPVRHILPDVHADTDTFVAGIAETGITPPPGMPLAGYSKLAVKSEGVRTKLMARAIYLKTPDSPSVALVQCDLLSGSLVLHHKVAERIAKKTDIDSGGLLICGTHTHSGPGNFFANTFYNNMAANKPGFDDQYFEFLADQIAKAVILSYENKRPAKLATGTTTITGVSINRCLEAYLRNPEAKNLQKKPDALDATNPYLHMIRIDLKDTDGTFRPAGAFINFSMHNNTSPKELGSICNGDILGYVSRQMSGNIKNTYHPSWKPLCATANYTHGDSNPNHDQERVETFSDLKKISNVITEKAFSLFQSLDDKLTDSPMIGYRAKEIDVFSDNTIDGISIAKRPVVGMPTIGGAQGRGRQTIASHIPFFAPGYPRLVFTGGEHGHKRHAGGPFQSLILPKDTFPHHLFLQAIRIHDTVLLPLPFEVTYTLGMRMAEDAQQKSKKAGMTGVNRFIVTSVSNGYWGYATTPEEYSIQYYEGGSTLFGPHTGPFLSAHVSLLMEEMALKGSGGAFPEPYDIPLEAMRFYQKDVTPNGERSILKAPEFHLQREPEEPFWLVKWVDIPKGGIDLHRGLVRIETSPDQKSWKPLTQNGIPVDDDGGDIAIRCTDERKKTHMADYEARWYSPKIEDTAFYRFVILPRGKFDTLYSNAFH